MELIYGTGNPAKLSFMKRALEGLEGWIECFDQAEFAGSVFVGNVNDPGEIIGSEGLKRAFRLGSLITV